MLNKNTQLLLLSVTSILYISNGINLRKKCKGSKFIEFVNSFVPDKNGDLTNIPYGFEFIHDPDFDELYEHGTEMKIGCKSRMYFAYPTSSKSLICDNGEIKQTDVSKYNHCIKNDQCSAAYFDRDWIIDGYGLNSKINSLLDYGPIIANSFNYNDETQIEKLLKKYKGKLPSTIKTNYQNGKSDPTGNDHSTFPSLLLLKCDMLYSLSSSNTGNLYKPHAFCVKDSNWKTAKWSMTNSISKWKNIQSQCTKLIKNPLSTKSSPPLDGCSVLSEKREQCILYKKYCAWDEFQKVRPKFDLTKVDGRICTQQCLPWSCFSALIKPINCEDSKLNLNTKAKCEKNIPLYTYWCKWDNKKQLCKDKRLKENKIDYPIQVDICSTNIDSCRASKKNDYWREQREIFSGNIEKLNQIKFGHKYKLFGIRFIVKPLSSLTMMRGSVITHIRATTANHNDPTKLNIDQPVIIEPNQVKRKFGVVQRKMYHLINKLYNLDNTKKIIEDYEYVSIELKSDEIEKASLPISFYLSTYIDKDCHRCILEKAKQSGIGSRVNAPINTLYVVSTSTDIDKPSLVKMQFPSTKKANVKLKMKVTVEPGPERCGRNDLGCFILLEPIMNDVASGLFTFKSILPIKARLRGFDDSVITIFGASPSKRGKVTAKYTVKVAKIDEFVQYENQVATIRWKVDMGLVKSIQINKNELAEYEQTIRKPTKIEFKQFDKLKTRPDKTKWILLVAKKSLPMNCNIVYECNLCGIEIKPKSILIRKGFQRIRIKVKATIPGEFQIHFQTTGECANLVENPPTLIVEVFQPNAGFVQVPETLDPIVNNEWSEDFEISISRPPFRTELKVKPLSAEIIADPLELRFDNVKTTMIQKSAVQLSKLGITKSHTVRIKPVLECGGGKPYELRWRLSGAIDEFYGPHSTMVQVEPNQDLDDDYCKFKRYEELINGSNGTNIDFNFMDNEKNVRKQEILIKKDTKWSFEYYLISGSVIICILIIINQFKQDKQDRIISIISSQI